MNSEFVQIETVLQVGSVGGHQAAHSLPLYWLAQAISFSVLPGCWLLRSLGVEGEGGWDGTD